MHLNTLPRYLHISKLLVLANVTHSFDILVTTSCAIIPIANRPAHMDTLQNVKARHLCGD